MVIRVHSGGGGNSISLWKAPGEVFGNVWKHRDLTRHMIRKDIKLTYHGTVLGYFWTLLEPLLFTAILYAVFMILRGQSDPKMPLLVIIGIMIFSCFSRTVSACTQALVNNSSLIAMIYFPREIFHASIVGFQLYKLVMSLLVIIPMMIWLKITPSVTLLLLIPAILGIGMLAVGIGMFASILQVRIRDVSQLVTVLLRAGFFISGVFYGAEHVPPEWVDIHLLNPVAVYIEMSRNAIIGADYGVLELRHMLVAGAFSLSSLIIGMFFFKRNESKVVKYL